MKKVSTRTWVCAGVDIGKSSLAYAVAGGDRPVESANSVEGRAQLVAFLKRHNVRRVGMEASGGYEIEVAADVRAAGIEVVVFQPMQVKAYARFKLQRAKSDPIDAVLIAQCTAACDKPRDAPDPRLAPFAEHLTMIEQIEEDIARAKVRRERYRDPRLKQRLEDEIKSKTALKREEIKWLLKAVRAHKDLARKLHLLQSIQGIGERTALALVVRMPELGSLSREEAASLLGVAPFVHEIGPIQRAAADRRRAGARPHEPVRRSPRRRPPMEPRLDRPLRPSHQSRQTPHPRHRRLRPQNDHLRQHRVGARQAMANRKALETSI